ncbi:heme ABC exporter ATP-binding protein CcmA [Geobacillus thermodenitrificans]|jgi:ABC-2 type transport system ATP-binding protein|uniref:heme ABC exporter ATP-binding protein CcmA n=1 Tax=Geobacillus thermodenitrificans TaxID=33940 RepID=UPI00040728C3|nr:heme ABC exporter ATP-binding protein CcmA [Geobacillus thermodenitrificans]ARA97365.1 heme ABC exporter, ATP-binding protein CcmA [Geobacillus thermodenitrificans]MED3905120.1 heme ABC exporter ATP-binding protein CcmA [Geobacillus thermodenitrificans]
MAVDPCIQVEHVSKRFGKKIVIDDVSLNVHAGEIFGLLGPSGAGKTTLVRMIAGIDQASEGAVRVLGADMPELTTMKRIGFMAQSDALYGELTALENMQFFASIYGLRGKKKKERIDDMLELVNLADDRKKPVHQYSGGMKRRLSLAIALLHEPEVLILDEPTVGIDPVLRQSIWAELKQIQKRGTAIVVTTHIMDEAEKCGRLGMIRDGRLLAVGRPDELKSETKSQTLEQAFLHFGGVHQ